MSGLDTERNNFDSEVVSEAQPISLVIITFNEEKNIERCIKSVPFAKDIVVLDSGSQDRTLEIARRLGARIVVEPWRGFAKQKIRATALARFDWVLSLDADEALSPEAQEEVQSLLNGEIKVDAFAFPRVTFHLGKWIYHGGMYPDYQTRLFHKQKAKWLDKPVHEKIQAENIIKLKSKILHWSFRNIMHQIETINKYSSLRAQDFSDQGKKFSFLKLVVKPFSKFIEVYFIKAGFRDGAAGLIIGFVSSFATFLRWAKLYEIERVTKLEKNR